MILTNKKNHTSQNGRIYVQKWVHVKDTHYDWSRVNHSWGKNRRQTIEFSITYILQKEKPDKLSLISEAALYVLMISKKKFRRQLFKQCFLWENPNGFCSSLCDSCKSLRPESVHSKPVIIVWPRLKRKHLFHDSTHSSSSISIPLVARKRSAENQQFFVISKNSV